MREGTPKNPNRIKGREKAPWQRGMGCCVSRAGDDAPGGASSSRYAPAEPESVENDAVTARGDASDALEDEWLSALDPEVREVFVELDAATRLALAPALRRNAKRALSDEYDESTSRRIGKGGFSVVYAVKHRRTGETFAAKVVSMRASEEEGSRTSERRVSEPDERMFRDSKTRAHAARGSAGLTRLDALRALLCEAAVPALAPHESVVAFRDLILESRRAVLVQEFCPGGSLLDVVQKEVDRKRAARRAAADETRRRSREHRRSGSREELASIKGKSARRRTRSFGRSGAPERRRRRARRRTRRRAQRARRQPPAAASRARWRVCTPRASRTET